MNILDQITPDHATDATKPPEMRNWRYEPGKIVQLWLDCEGTGTNVISEAVLRELDALLEQVSQDQPEALIIRSAKPAGFAAGADIDGLTDLRGDDATQMLEQGHAVFDKLAALPFTTAAVIHGNTLGGGLELALACDHRIGVVGMKAGFPEVRLGLHPGLGGTFRLTQLIDPLEAMQIMLTGRSVYDRKAKKLGIIDALVPERHVEAAIQAAASGKLAHDTGGLRAAALRTRAARSLAANRMRAESDKRAPTRHYPAPFALIDLWEDHGGDTKKMQQAEIASFANLLDSTTSKNLIRVFYLRRKLKDAGKGEGDIAHVHVIGTGIMGAEIAAWAAMQGKRVTIEDVALEPLGTAIKHASKIYERKHLSEIDLRDALDRLMPDPDGLGRARADLIIEAAPEKLALKEQIYAALTNVMKPGAILATNTSSLSLTDLVDATPEPGRFAGLHFFNPVSSMQLIEVVSHGLVRPDTLDRLAAFCTAIDRLPARVTDYPGFLVNRILGPYLLEAMVLLENGHNKEKIDRAALAFGMPMGPVALADKVGLDICLAVVRSLRGSLDRPLADTPEWLEKMIRDGNTGRKSGKGLYDYDNGEEPPSEASEKPPQDLVDRLILPMCDAGVECLRKGVAADADTIDAAMIFGAGFAPFRGGPMHYARVRGDVPDQLHALARQHGDRFIPDPGWAAFD